MSSKARDLLTDTKLKGKDAKPKEKGFYLADGDKLFLRVLPSGVRYWVFIYKDAARKNQNINLGNYPEISLADARAKADVYRTTLANKLDPKEEAAKRLAEQKRERERQAERERLEAAKLTMNQLFEEWDAHHGATLDPHWRAVRQSHWRVHLAPLFGSHKVASATRQQAMKLYDRMVKDGKEATARKVLSLLKQIMQWAVERDHAAPNHELLHANPPKPKRRVTDDQLPENFDIEAHLAKHGESVIGDDGEDDLAGRALQFGELVLLLSERLPAAAHLPGDQVAEWRHPHHPRAGHDHAERRHLPDHRLGCPGKGVHFSSPLRRVRMIKTDFY
ncbi:MAG: DUF4102 domain-containing protein [Pseudogulbenkiania sp.]|nr:DUF4102 domain-containing protein [Pseudogulbenkiania sp.]